MSKTEKCVALTRVLERSPIRASHEFALLSCYLSLRNGLVRASAPVSVVVPSHGHGQLSPSWFAP
jgi:hypothetical protein